MNGPTRCAYTFPGLTTPMQEVAAMKDGTCVNCGRQRPITAKGLCSTCYTYAYRERNAQKFTLVCQQCGAEFKHHGRTKRYCSPSCGRKAGSKTRHDETVKRYPNVIAEETYFYGKFAAVKNAVHAGDGEAAIREIREHADLADSGCWLWKHYLNSTGYGYIQTRDNKKLLVHRLVAAAKHGRLDPGAIVHHTCHVRRCVNPDHLQPTSQRNNVVEMLERGSLLKRIASLESALREYAPDHDLFNHLLSP